MSAVTTVQSRAASDREVELACHDAAQRRACALGSSVLALRASCALAAHPQRLTIEIIGSGAKPDSDRDRAVSRRSTACRIAISEIVAADLARSGFFA